MKKTNYIVCPFCNKEFQLTDAIAAQIESELKNDFQEQLEKLKAEKNEALVNQKTELEKIISQKYEKQFEKLMEEEAVKMRETANKKAKKEFDTELKEKEEEIEEANKKLDLYRKK